MIRQVLDSTRRWRRAQEAERDHAMAHDRLRTPEEAREVFDHYFSRDVSTFEGQRVLSVGSGTGHVHAFDFDCGNVGVDPLTHRYDAVADSDAGVCTGVGEHLPFADDSFDVVFSINVLDHYIDPDDVLAEIRRVLRPGGEFLLQVNVFELPAAARRLPGPVDPPHPHHFSSASITDRVREAGFEVTAAETFAVSGENRTRNYKLFVAATMFRLKRFSLTAVSHE
jgi:SAM-dependent methyltransferase